MKFLEDLSEILNRGTNLESLALYFDMGHDINVHDNMYFALVDVDTENKHSDETRYYVSYDDSHRNIATVIVPRYKLPKGMQRLVFTCPKYETEQMISMDYAIEQRLFENKSPPNTLVSVWSDYPYHYTRIVQWTNAFPYIGTIEQPVFESDKTCRIIVGVSDIVGEPFDLDIEKIYKRSEDAHGGFGNRL